MKGGAPMDDNKRTPDDSYKDLSLIHILHEAFLTLAECAKSIIFGGVFLECGFVFKKQFRVCLLYTSRCV